MPFRLINVMKELANKNDLVIWYFQLKVPMNIYVLQSVAITLSFEIFFTKHFGQNLSRNRVEVPRLVHMWIWEDWSPEILKFSILKNTLISSVHSLVPVTVISFKTVTFYSSKMILHVAFHNQEEVCRMEFFPKAGNWEECQSNGMDFRIFRKGCCREVLKMNAILGGAATWMLCGFSTSRQLNGLFCCNSDEYHICLTTERKWLK